MTSIRGIGTSAPETPVHWAVVGLGTGGRVFHAPMLRAANNVRLAAFIASPRYAGDSALGSVEVLPHLEAAADQGVEAVTITTPAGSHEELAHRALALGLHVVVDKPVALNASGARALIAHARSVGRLLSVYQNRRWDGDFLTVAELVRSGRLGEVHRFYNRIQRFRPALPAWNSEMPAESGGGTLLDLCPHLVDQATVLLGPVTEVSAELARRGGGRGTENDVLLTLEHASGAHSVVEASAVAATQAHRLQVNASRGGLTVDGFDRQEEDLFAGRTPENPSWGLEPSTRRAVLVTEQGREQLPLQRGSWPVFYARMTEAIRGRGPVPVAPEDAARTAAVLDAARLSAHRRAWVRLADEGVSG